MLSHSQVKQCRLVVSWLLSRFNHKGFI